MGRSIGWLVGWLVDWLVGWLVIVFSALRFDNSQGFLAAVQAFLTQ